MNSDNDETSDSETDSDDDEVDEYRKWYDNIVSVVSLVGAAEEMKIQRQQYFVRQRQTWEMFAKDLQEEKAFRRYYRMEKESFYKLKELTGILFNLDEEMSGRRTNWQEPIGIEFILHCTLRYLAGSTADDIRIACGISRSSFYRCMHQGISLILACKELEIKFPSSTIEIEQAATGFRAVSRNEIIKGCVGALDGWLCKIETPSASETSNARAFHSGHYNAQGVNVQACCDSDCRFTHVSINSPGSTNDVIAYAESSLCEMVDGLPDGKYIVADNAYINTNKLLTPYSGQQRADPSKDTFNFYLSQCRIRIEQAFGQLTNVWRVFKCPLRLSLENIPRLIHAAMCLHNFCIDERQGGFDNDDKETPPKIRVLSDDELEEFNRNYQRIETPNANVRRRHTVRESILNEIREGGLQRPKYNRLRNV
jgi:DDE superfamily endonuclease